MAEKIIIVKELTDDTLESQRDDYFSRLKPTKPPEQELPKQEKQEEKTEAKNESKERVTEEESLEDKLVGSNVKAENNEFNTAYATERKDYFSENEANNYMTDNNLTEQSINGLDYASSNDLMKENNLEGMTSYTSSNTYSGMNDNKEGVNALNPYIINPDKNSLNSYL